MSEWKPRRRPRRAQAEAAEKKENQMLVGRCKGLKDIAVWAILICCIVLRFLDNRIKAKTQLLILAVLLLLALPVQGYAAYIYLKLPKADRRELRWPYFRTPVTDFVTGAALEIFMWVMWFGAP